MNKDVFIYNWNNVLDREFQIPENVIHFDNKLKVNLEPFNVGHCYANSLWKKTGLAPNFKKAFKGVKGYSELKLCVGIIVNKLFFKFIGEGEHERWLKIFDGKLEPKPCVYFHAWNLARGRVIDVTLGKNANDYEYLGFIVPETEVAKMRNSPCVRRYLDHSFGLSQDAHYHYREGRQPKHRKEVII